MAFFQLILKAKRLEKARLNYEDEKLRSIEISRGIKPHLTLERRLRRKRLRDGTLENYIMKSVFGFFGGISLTYMFFVFFVFQLNFTLWSATMLCSLLGMILTLGLAFSYRVRCIVFLLLPQFFSKRGRQALMAYAFILTLTGPGKNMLHNTSVLSESLACGQEQLKQAVKNVIDLIKEPFYALRDAISKVIRTVKMIVKKIKRTLVAIKRLVLSILRVITSVFQWLGSVVSICNKKLGTPYDRCQGVFEGAVADCKAKLGPLFGGICNLTYVVGALCYIVKPLDFICMLVSYVADTIVDAVRKKIKRFTRHIKAMFYVKVKFSHSFHFETNQSKTMENVSTDIITEIRSRTDRFLAVFDWMSFMATFFVFFMLLKIMYYRHKWLTNERFDNRYLTNDLRIIDLIRTRQNKETILPLNHREKNQYIPLTSITLIKVERVKLAKSVIFLTLAMFKICIHMMADYSLYWILNTIRYHGRIETKVQRPNFVGVHVSGEGYLADLYRSIVKAFTPQAKDTEIDLMPCLPDPIPPDLDRYTQIATLIAFCWIMTIFEPYGLRLRQVVMCKYHPERARQRAAWLYNHIIRSRGSFLKFARRQLRRKFGMIDGESIERVTFRERCLAICPFLDKLFPRKQNMCLLCGVAERFDQEPHIKCATPACVGLFCIQCFADLQNLCTICRSPIEYGDLSDLSEEKDSSDDQFIARKEFVPIIYKKAEPVVEEKPKEEIKMEEISEKDQILEERIPAEIISKEIIPDEKMPEEQILADEKEKIIERKDKAVQTDDEVVESSSESIYSYTYQEESSREIEIERRKTPFKDVEAQKIREDVTIQIFNDPLAKEITSSSEDPTSCFMVRARRRLRSKFKRKSSPRKDDDSSTSIADTESWPTEELDEEEVIHIEMDDGSKELLLKDSAAKEKKRSRVRRILAALARIPWLGKRTTDSDNGWRTRRSSLIDSIARMLPGNHSNSPVRTYRRIRKMRKDAKRKGPSPASSSSSDEEDEQRALLKTRDRQVDCLQIISDYGDSEDNIYSRHYDSHRARRGTICRQPDPRMRVNDAILQYPHEKKFATKTLPRYLEPILNDTVYFEVDEIKDSQSKRKSARVGDRTNVLSDIRTSVDRTDKWNNNDDYSYISCSCTSEISCSIKENSKIYQLNVTERSDEIWKTDEMSEADEELLTAEMERSDKGKKMGKIVIPIETSTNTGTDRQEVSGENLIRDDQREFLMKNSKVIEKLNNIGKENFAKKYFAKKERLKKLEAEEKTEASMTSTANEKVRLYDPLADLRLYGVTCQAKRCEKSVKEKLTKQAEAIETRVDDRNAAESTEYEESIEMIQKPAQIIEHGIRKFAEMPEKGIQTDLRKSQGYNGIDIDAANICRVVNVGKKRERKMETRWQKWIDKRKRRKKSNSSRKRKPCDKATLIKEKQCKRRKREKTCDRNVQTQEQTRRAKDFSYTSCAKRHPDDIQRQRKVAASFTPTIALNENRQSQCNLRYRGNLQGRQDNVRDLEFANKPKVCDVRSQFETPEQTIHCRDYNYWNREKFSIPRNEYVTSKHCGCYKETSDIYATQISRHLPSHTNVHSSQLTSSLEKKTQQRKERRYDVNVRETRLEIPMLKKYLPAYQTPGLIEELKEHDRIRLIQEREARRRMALNALRNTRDSPLSAESIDRASCSISVRCDAHESVSKLTSVSTKLTEGNNLPYQETQAFRDVVCEFRKKVTETKRPVLSLSRRADECKDLKQLFPPENKDDRNVATMPNLDETIGRFKLMNNKQERCGTIHEREQSFENESFSEISSIYSYPCKHHRSGATTSADDTTDDNNDTS